MNQRTEKEWIALLLLNRLGLQERRRARDLFAEGQCPTRVLETLELKNVTDSIPFDPQKEFAQCWQKGVSLCAILDENYPMALKEIPDPPLVLYMKGELEVSDANALAIVGTRHPSFYGRSQAKRFSGELASKGITIVSGLARGIDQTAHEAALDVPYGRTVAVLGCGIDVIYPKENEKLFDRIIRKGALISEYAIGTPPLAENFPKRNRIISGLSHGVFVVEAHSRSGSLITAHEALDQGREVFSLPGPVDQLTSRGTHQLIKEGAALVENPEEIFEALSGRWKIFSDKKHVPDPVIIAARPSVLLKPAELSLTKKENAAGAEFFAEKESGTDNGVEKAATGESHFSRQRALDKQCRPGRSPREADPSMLSGGDPVPEETTVGNHLNEGGDTLTGEDKIISEILEEEGPLGLDDLLDISGIEPQKLPALLLKMELAGTIKKQKDGLYFKNR